MVKSDDPNAQKYKFYKWDSQNLNLIENDTKES